MTTAHWGMVLIIAALLAMVWQVRRWRSKHITLFQFSAGMLARIGFLVLGIMYATDVVYRSKRAPFIGLGIVGIGIVLNLTAGIIENIRRAHAPRADEQDTTD